MLLANFSPFLRDRPTQGPDGASHVLNTSPLLQNTSPYDMYHFSVIHNSTYDMVHANVLCFITFQIVFFRAYQNRLDQKSIYISIQALFRCFLEIVFRLLCETDNQLDLSSWVPSYSFEPIHRTIIPPGFARSKQLSR